MSRYSSFRPSDLKIENKASVFRYIFEKNVVTKSDISKDLGISKPTASLIVSELVRDKLVLNAGVGISTSQGGKKPHLYEVDLRSTTALAIYIGPAILQGVLTDLRANVLHSIQIDHDDSSAERLVDAISQIISELLAEGKRLERRVSGIGISAPGVVNSTQGILVSSVHHEEWNGLPLGNIINGLFQLPVRVNNEANNMALAEKWFGIGNDHSIFIAVQTKGGLGAGIILNDEIYHRDGNSGGEFGHTTVNSDGPTCRCGNIGCWEMFATELVLLSEVEKAANDPLSLEQIGKLYLQGDSLIVSLVRRYADHLVTGIVNMVNVFNPELVILRGNLRHLGTPFLDYIHQAVVLRTFSSVSKDFLLKYSELPEYTEVIGAATLIIKDVVDGRLSLENAE